jgi:SAM-dependent methyltransferase
MDWHSRFMQQAAWTHDLRVHLFERAGLNQARRVLEVGCGTGAILSNIFPSPKNTLELLPQNRDFPTPFASLHGLDLESSRLVSARLLVPAAALVCGDALKLPYPLKEFDITFCHFLLLWVAEPLLALQEMKRVTRPGGSVLALAEPDYESRQDKPAAFAPLGRWQVESLRQQGADPGIGSRLADLFRQAGIQPIETGTLRKGRQHPPTPGPGPGNPQVEAAGQAGLGAGPTGTACADIFRLGNRLTCRWYNPPWRHF